MKPTHKNPPRSYLSKEDKKEAKALRNAKRNKRHQWQVMTEAA